MNCIHCGQPINPGSRFCIACGREQVDRTSPRPPETPPQPTPAQQQYQGPSLPHAVHVPQKTGSAKVLVGLAAALMLLFGIGGVVAYFYFFPPGVFVRDSFGKPHPQIVKEVESLGNKAKYVDNKLQIFPPSKQFYMLLYDVVVSDNVTVEGTIEWIEGDQDSMFGIVCCASNNQNFHVLMLTGKNNYTLQGYFGNEWYDLTGFLKLPKTKEIRRNVPYKLTIKTEEDIVSAYLDDQLLIQFVDAIDHKGRVGIYAQGGTNGQTSFSFSSFRAKKNSMFQSD
jgi:hypothetical protein